MQINLIKLEARPVAQEMIRTEFLDEARRTIEAEGLLSVTIPCSGSHTDLYIFKHPHLEHVIKFNAGLDADKLIWSEWCIGKMFGYSESDIARHIEAELATAGKPRREGE